MDVTARTSPVVSSSPNLPRNPIMRLPNDAGRKLAASSESVMRVHVNVLPSVRLDGINYVFARTSEISSEIKNLSGPVVRDCISMHRLSVGVKTVTLVRCIFGMIASTVDAPPSSISRR